MKRVINAKLLLLVSLFSDLILISSGALETITTSTFLTDKTTLVSSGGTFELGFFSSNNSTNWFLGIWYKKIPTKTVVWTANRDTPLNYTSGVVLKITEQGFLSLVNNYTNTAIWSSADSSPRSTNNMSAELLETGNLVVRDKTDADPKNYLWQSFDHPTDTFLPEMKLGSNLLTGVNRFLSNGNYTLGIDIHGFPQLFLEKDSVEQFRSGPWNGLRFSSSPGLQPNEIYSYDFVNNLNEVYYIYRLLDSSVYSRMVLNQSGVFQRFIWNVDMRKWDLYLEVPGDECDSYGLCRGYGSCSIRNSPVCGCLDRFVPKYDKKISDSVDQFSGCVRRTPLDCRNGDSFVKYSGIKLPDTRQSWYNYSMNLEECKNACEKNCTCMAYASINIARSESTGCLHWFEDLIDMRVLTASGPDIYIRMASSETDSTEFNVPSSKKRRNNMKRIGLIIVLSGVVLLVGLILILVYVRKKEKARQSKQQQQQQQLQKEKDLELPLFNLATIAEATDNFSEKNMLGEGGFGPVYRGKLNEGQQIAVKRLSQNSAQGLDEFMNEVICITKLQHRNLVKLLGCYIQEQEKMLIYEYMSNNSVDFYLFDQTRSELLVWQKRFNIINGTARGLLYLHQDSRLRIIHRDLKPDNILLDIDMNPKISDFGMAKSFGGNEIAANTNRVVGTYGYMSPEYAADGIFSVKSDVFSFGVVVLEIVSGKRNRVFKHADHHHNLLGHAWLLHMEGRSLELLDEILSDSCDQSEVIRSIHVGLLCVQQHAEDRPSMSSVVHMLDSDGELPQPSEPGFYTKKNYSYETNNSSTISVNEISMTQLEAR